MIVQDLIQTAIETELELGGDPKSCASHVIQTLVDEGFGITETAPFAISDTVGLAKLPNLSVVQFRGEALGERSSLVYQLDEEWFSPGCEESVKAEWFSAEVFPAVVLWMPRPTALKAAADAAERA
jgi:hypothetical protein